MIQPFTEDDLARLPGLQPDGWKDIMPAFRFYLAAEYCFPVKIAERNRAVAIGSVVLHADTAWLAHIIVDSSRRRHGLGTVVTEALVAFAEGRGRNTQLLIATGMGEPLYAGLGFRRSCGYRFYREPPVLERTFPPRVRPCESTDLDDVLSLDRRATGERRCPLIADGVSSGWVGRDGHGAVRGYFLPQLGEGSVVADDVEVGLALMKMRLALTGEAPVLPEGNHAAHALLRDLGVEPCHEAVRMVRNGRDRLRQEMLFNRVGGHLG